MEQEKLTAFVFGGKSISFDALNPTDYIQREILKNKTFYELDVLEEISRMPLKSGTICDVGANIGNHTLYFSIILGRPVVAIEPGAEAFDALRRNVAINRCESVQLHNLALGSHASTGNMKIVEGNLGASRFVPGDGGAVKLVRLDEIVPIDQEIALLKIDTEGHDHDVLVGAENTIRKHQPLIVVEAQDTFSFSRIQDLLARHDYTPIGMKGKTATYFFLHQSQWKQHGDIATFLIRKDLDHVSRRLHGQMDRLSRVATVTSEAQTRSEQSLVQTKELATQVAGETSGLRDLLRQNQDRIQSALEGIDASTRSNLYAARQTWADEQAEHWQAAQRHTQELIDTGFVELATKIAELQHRSTEISTGTGEQLTLTAKAIESQRDQFAQLLREQAQIHLEHTDRLDDALKSGLRATQDEILVEQAHILGELRSQVECLNRQVSDDSQESRARTSQAMADLGVRLDALQNTKATEAQFEAQRDQFAQLLLEQANTHLQHTERLDDSLKSGLRAAQEAHLLEQARLLSELKGLFENLNRQANDDSREIKAKTSLAVEDICARFEALQNRLNEVERVSSDTAAKALDASAHRAQKINESIRLLGADLNDRITASTEGVSRGGVELMSAVMQVLEAGSGSAHQILTAQDATRAQVINLLQRLAEHQRTADIDGQAHAQRTQSEVKAAAEVMQSQFARNVANARALIITEIGKTAQSRKAIDQSMLQKLQSTEESIQELNLNQQDIQALEGEISRLLIVVQTERARTQFLSRRLNTLYTGGIRKQVAGLRTFLHRFLPKQVKPYETWAEFQSRLETRTKREVDDFKKLHFRLDETARRAPRKQPVEKVTTSPGPSSAQFALVPPALTVATSTPATPVLGVGRERVRIGIASIKLRLKALEQVIESLYHQADEFLIYLNDHKEVPAFLQRDKIRVITELEDVGDRGKFYEVEKFSGYVFSCDDDILYPNYYVRHCVDAIERYGRKAAVGWHGSVFKFPFVEYYSPESRRVFSFRSGRPSDIAAHVLGTGCTAFHSSTIRVKFSDFKTSNMADVYFALLGQEQDVPFVVIKHDAGEALPIEIEDDKAIHRESMQKTGSKADTRDLQNQLVKAWPQWKAEAPPLVFKRDTHTIAYVGRIDVERWKKGGILKSSQLIIDALRTLGHRIIQVEIDQKLDQIQALTKDANIVWIYPGDPERPDFEPVEKLIEVSAAAGKQVFVNLSYNLKPERTQWIGNKLRHWKTKHGSKVTACLFTYSAMNDPALADLRDNLICLPKSIDFARQARPLHEETSGIFLGDLQKLLNRGLVAGDIEDWIAELRRSLPGVKLHVVRQYGGKIDRELGLDVTPYTTGEAWDRWLASRRILCCLTPHATFEMIPVEGAGLGIPVVYRPMPHAQTEVLSVAGIQVDTPKEFAEACRILYTDPIVWTMYSEAAQQRANSQRIEHVAASLHAQISIRMKVNS